MKTTALFAIIALLSGCTSTETITTNERTVISVEVLGAKKLSPGDVVSAHVPGA
jgi:predicted component of type VI protein secretion system